MDQRMWLFIFALPSDVKDGRNQGYSSGLGAEAQNVLCSDGRAHLSDYINSLKSVLINKVKIKTKFSQLPRKSL